MADEFTPGEWKVEYDNSDSSSGGQWFTVGPAKVWFSYSAKEGVEAQARADAHLISAAPNLLVVAKHCEQMLMAYEINRVNGEEIADEALRLIRAAIAKALGEPS